MFATATVVGVASSDTAAAVTVVAVDAVATGTCAEEDGPECAGEAAGTWRKAVNQRSPNINKTAEHKPGWQPKRQSKYSNGGAGIGLFWIFFSDCRSWETGKVEKSTSGDDPFPLSPFQSKRA